MFPLMITLCIFGSVAPDLISLPVDIQSNAKEIVLFGDTDVATCCGSKITFKDSLATLNLKDCMDLISCKDEEWTKQIIKTTCKEIKLQNGCATRKQQYENQTSFTVRCVCSKHGLLCPDGLDKNFKECSNLKEGFVNHNDDIIFLQNRRPDFKVAMLQDYYIEVFPIGNNKTSNINVVVKNKQIKVHLDNADNKHCKVTSDVEVCNFICKSKICEFGCDVKTSGKKDKILSKIVCGSDLVEFWLFRDGLHKNAMLESHSHWRTHSRILGTIFIVDLAFGFLILEIVFYLLQFCYKITKYLYHNFIYTNIRNFVHQDTVLCDYCQNPVEDIHDAILHEKYCQYSTCPYCKDDMITFTANHVMNCSSRKSALKAQRLNEKETISKIMMDINSEEGFKMPTLRKNALLFKIWSSSLAILIIFILIAPGDAKLMDKPCNRLIGRTSDCMQRNSDQVLRGSPEVHNHWSSVELGMINELEKHYTANSFSYHALHRLKNTVISSYNDQTSIVLSEGMCNQKSDSCKGYSDIEWSTDVYQGAIQSFKTANKDKMESTFNIFIPDVETVTIFKILYKTSDWKIIENQHFSCTENDCSKVCKDDPKDKCPKIKNKRENDSSWKHNPYWCLSINTGCTCVNSKVVPKDDSDVYLVLKPIKTFMQGLLCVEQNNIFIDCVTIDKPITKTFSHGKMIIREWKPTISIPDTFIVKVPSGSNNSYTDAFVGNACEQGNCNAGSIGDYQFMNNSNYCEGGAYFNTGDFQTDVIYSFAETPSWQITGPTPGVYQINNLKHMNDYLEFTDHSVNLESNTLTVKGGNLGIMNMKFYISGIELFSLNDDSKILQFGVKNCQGYYMSDLGSICTFIVEMKGAGRTIVKIESGDNSNIIESDSQLITEGQNIFRKFMLTRSKQPFYKYCLIHKERRLCSDFKYNLTDPSMEWKYIPSTSMILKNNEKAKNCDAWFGLTCIWSRFVDFFKTMWSALYILIAGLLIYIVFIIAKSFLSSIFGDRSSILINTRQESMKEKVKRLRKKFRN